MTHSLFNAPAGGSLQDKVDQALRFAQGAGGIGAAAPPAPEDVRAVAGAAPDAAAAPAAASVATEVAAPVAAQSPDLATAARAAAEQAIADPAFVAGAQQQVDVAAAAIPEAPRGGGLRSQLADALAAARGPVADTSTIADRVAVAVPDPVAAARPSLLDRIRANGPSIDDLAALGRRGGGAALLADDAAATITTATATTSGRGASLLDQLRDAAQVAQRINPRG